VNEGRQPQKGVSRSESNGGIHKTITPGQMERCTKDNRNSRCRTPYANQPIAERACEPYARFPLKRVVECSRERLSRVECSARSRPTQLGLRRQRGGGAVAGTGSWGGAAAAQRTKPATHRRRNATRAAQSAGRAKENRTWEGNTPATGIQSGAFDGGFKTCARLDNLGSDASKLCVPSIASNEGSRWILRVEGGGTGGPGGVGTHHKRCGGTILGERRRGPMEVSDLMSTTLSTQGLPSGPPSSSRGRRPLAKHQPKESPHRPTLPPPCESTPFVTYGSPDRR